MHEEICSICREPLRETDKVVYETKCHHKFHKDCLTSYCKYNNNNKYTDINFAFIECPLCKTKLNCRIDGGDDIFSEKKDKSNKSSKSSKSNKSNKSSKHSDITETQIRNLYNDDIDEDADENTDGNIKHMFIHSKNDLYKELKMTYGDRYNIKEDVVDKFWKNRKGGNKSSKRKKYITRRKKTKKSKSRKMQKKFYI